MDGLGVYQINDNYWFYYVYAESAYAAIDFFIKGKKYPPDHRLTGIEKLKDNDLDETFTENEIGEKISIRDWLGDEAKAPPCVIGSTLPHFSKF